MNANKIVEQLKNKIAGFESEVRVEKVGEVLQVGDGVARVSGLSQVGSMEIVEFDTASGKVAGVVLNLEESEAGVVILGEQQAVKEGQVVRSTGRILSVPVGDNLVGRVVNPLGEALDGRGDIKSEKYYPVEKIAPGVITRESVKVPLQTGLKAIDAMIPIGRGQRELIIGDRQTGKTAIALDAIINQMGQGVICIYVAVGQKNSTVASI